MYFKKLIDDHRKKIWQDTLMVMDGLIAKRKMLFDSLRDARTLEIYLEDTTSLVSQAESIYKKIGELYEKHDLFSSWIMMVKYNRILDSIRDQVIHVW